MLEVRRSSLSHMFGLDASITAVDGDGIVCGVFNCEMIVGFFVLFGVKINNKLLKFDVNCKHVQMMKYEPAWVGLNYPRIDFHLMT